MQNIDNAKQEKNKKEWKKNLVNSLALIESHSAFRRLNSQMQTSLSVLFKTNP